MKSRMKIWMKKGREVLSRNKAVLVRVAVMVVGAGFGHAASASTGSGMPWESALTQIQDSISGPVAGAISVCGIGAAGLTMVFGGEMNEWVKRLIYLVAACALMFGGGTLVQKLYSTSGALI